MKKTFITIGLTTLVLLTLVAIVSSQTRVNNTFSAISNALPGDASYSYGGGGGGAPELYAQEAPPVAPSVGSGGGDGTVVRDALDQPSSIQDDGTRMVIKNADMAIVVKDPKADMARISRLAEEMGGFVVASNLYQSYYGPNSIEVPEATITIRVPSEKLEEVLAEIKENAVDVDYENVSGQDVTSTYVDLQSRLSAKQAAEKKLLEILEDAEETEDVLAVYAQLQLIQTDIEVLLGQIKYYDESVALSAVSVRLIAQEGTQPIAIGPWEPSGAAKEAIENLIRFFQNFIEFLIQLVIFVLPALILMAIPAYLAFLAGRAIFRRFSKSKVTTEEITVEEKK